MIKSDTPNNIKISFLGRFNDPKYEGMMSVSLKIKELGGKPAFPTQLSINEIAAHYNPFVNDETKFKEGDLVKLDLGVHINGAVADIAVTVDLGDHAALVKASKDALQAAIDFIKPGVELREVGKVIGETKTK